jgi:hypothetical protein
MLTGIPHLLQHSAILQDEAPGPGEAHGGAGLEFQTPNKFFALFQWDEENLSHIV